MEQTVQRGKPAMMLGLVLVLLMLLVAACGEADANVGSGGNADPTATPHRNRSSIRKGKPTWS